MNILFGINSVIRCIGDDLKGILILNIYHGISVAMRYSLLDAPQKYSEEIHTKLSLRYDKDVLCQRFLFGADSAAWTFGMDNADYFAVSLILHIFSLHQDYF
jgi:hypothetical protein